MWSPAQIIAFAAGLYWTIDAGLAMSRVHIDFGDLTHPLMQAGGLQQTPGMSLIALGFGLILILAALVVPAGSRSFITFLGVVAVGFGVAVLATASSTLQRDLGVTHDSGWAALFTGIALLVGVAVSPLATRSVVVERTGGTYTSR
jgi:hypothetical protein